MITLQMNYLLAQPWFTVLVVTAFLIRQSSAQDFATLALRARARADADTRFAGGTYISSWIKIKTLYLTSRLKQTTYALWSFYYDITNNGYPPAFLYLPGTTLLLRASGRELPVP